MLINANFQLSTFGNGTGATANFAPLRWDQTAQYGYVPNDRQKNVFMAVAMDLGNPNSTYGSIHPTDKTDVGNRLALAGLAVGYGKDKYYTGPLVANVKRQTKPPSTALEVTFKSLSEEIEVRNTTGFEVFYTSFIPQNMQKSHLSLSCDPTFALRVLLYASDLFARKFAAEIVTCF